MKVHTRSYFWSLSILVLACALKAQAKTTLHRVAKTSAAPMKITPQVLRGKIIFLRGSDIWMFDSKSRQEQIAFKDLIPDGRDVNQDGNVLAISPDLSYIAFIHPSENFIGSDLYLLNVNTNERRPLVRSKPEDEVLEPRFRPDGKKIVYTRLSNYHMPPGFEVMEIRIVNADRSDDHFVLTGAPQRIESYFDASWSQNGKRLLFSHSQGGVPPEL